MEEIKKNIDGIFNSNKIRKQKFDGEVFYVIEDVIKFILNSENPHQYLKTLKNRNLDFKKVWLQIVTPLKFETSKGKREINCTNLNGIFKLVEFIPSKKVEEFKNHLYEIGLLKIGEVGEWEKRLGVGSGDIIKMVKKLKVLGKQISIKKFNDEDFISLTDMLKAKDGDFFISDWLRNRNTIEFLGIWERIYNPNFNYGEYATIRNKAGLNNYKISVKEWTKKTNAIGLKATSGRYGGTYAHKDLAFEFGMWISAEFKIYLIKEFQRLKEEESKSLDWNVKRTLTKINYQIHTSAIKENLIPFKITKKQISQIYANEADILNVALYGKTANEWIKLNKKKQGNIRDYSNVSQLICLSNLESLNSVFIKSNLNQQKRLIKLNQIAISQMKILTQNREVDKLTDKKLVFGGKK